MEKNQCRIATYIMPTDKSKIEWNGPLKMLKELRVKLTRENASWTSLGGYYEKLKNKQTWIPALNLAKLKNLAELSYFRSKIQELKFNSQSKKVRQEEHTELDNRVRACSYIYIVLI